MRASPRTQTCRAVKSFQLSPGVATSGNRFKAVRQGRTAVFAIAAAATFFAPIGGGAAAEPQRQWCEARSSRAWHRVLTQHVVALSHRTSLVPWTLAHDGRSFFATVRSAQFTGIGRITAKTGDITRIKSFSDPANEQADGAFDGRWLVWNEYRGFTSFNNFTTWAWDSRTGSLRQIGASSRAPTGGFWESPWRAPDVRDGIATWVQGSGPDALTEVHVFDLRSGRDTLIRGRHAQGSFMLDRHLVAWPESPYRGAETRIYVTSSIGKPLPVPRALRGLRGVSALATDGYRIAFPTARYKSLWWASLRRAPQRIVAARNANHVDNSVQIAGRWIGFGIQPRVFVGDTRTRRYIEIASRGGWTRLDSKSLLVLHAVGSKALDAVAPITFVPLRELPPMPACS
jgi:hypothetical protein